MSAKPKQFEENIDQFKELVLHISQKCANDPNFDTLKLAKILFFSDFYAYAWHGAPITGLEYVKKEKGPVPKRIGEIHRDMQGKDKTLALQPLPLKQWDRPVNLRNPNLSGFNARQIALVDEIIDTLKDTDSESASEMSHQYACWKMTSLEQTIPYELVFVSLEEPTPADIERGQAVARELNLLELVHA